MEILSSILVFFAGLWAGTINAVVGSGTLVTFPRAHSPWRHTGGRFHEQRDGTGGRHGRGCLGATDANWQAVAGS